MKGHTSGRKSVCLVVGDMNSHNWRLQPWRYLSEVALQLGLLGHPVTVMCDSPQPIPAEKIQADVTFKSLASVRNPVWKSNRALVDALNQASPDIIIWHLGLTSFLYQTIPTRLGVPIIGFFSNPVYHSAELSHLGAGKLLRNLWYLKVHLAGALAPNWLIHSLINRSPIDTMVVQTETTRKQLQENGLWVKPIQVIPPGVDPCWLHPQQNCSAAIRSAWGFNADDVIALFFGSPAELRGLPTLIRAVGQARRNLPELKLVILLRRFTSNEWVKEERAIVQMIDNLQLQKSVRLIHDLLTPSVLAAFAASSDIVALPFELVPSDAPLSILEVLALGKPIVTTRVACLPELVAGGEGYLAEPGSTGSLADAIEQAAAEIKHKKKGDSQTLFNQEEHTWQAMGTAWSEFLETR